MCVGKIATVYMSCSIQETEDVRSETKKVKLSSLVK